MTHVIEFFQDQILIDDKYLFEGVDKDFFLDNVIESDYMVQQVDCGTPDHPYSYEIEVETPRDEIWDSLSDEQQSYLIEQFRETFKREEIITNNN